MQRREWLRRAATATAVIVGGRRKVGAVDEAAPFRVHPWRRDERNPVLPPGGGPFDVGCCMNPFIIVNNGEYWLYYAGADKTGGRRICLATCPIDDVTAWKRHGPL